MEFKLVVRVCCCVMDVFIYVVDLIKGNWFGKNVVRMKFLINICLKVNCIIILFLIFDDVYWFY